MRVLLIDPWGTNNTAEYLNGLIMGLNEKVDLTVVTNYYFSEIISKDYSLKKVFFKYSEKKKKGRFRSLLRGFEYIIGYFKIFLLLSNNSQYDVIHINWLLFYSIDIRILTLLKKKTKRIVYTAHNAVPHEYSSNDIEKLHIIYSIVDKVIVHGLSIKKEMEQLFPDIAVKIYIQKHGCIIHSPIQKELNDDEQEIVSKCKEYNKVLLFIGLIFWNKGVDRLIKDWIENHKDSNALLVIAGKTISQYQELEILKNRINETKNILFLNTFITDSLLDGLVRNCSIIILPYRHASMSGVVFTAASYDKPLLFTDCGAIREYLNPGVDSFCCKNTDEDLARGIASILRVDNETLKQMGIQLHKNIEKNCDWKEIANGIIDNVYTE